MRMSPGGAPLSLVEGVVAPRGVFVTATVALALLPTIVKDERGVIIRSSIIELIVEG